MKLTSAKDGKVTRLPLPLPLVSQPSQLRSPETSEVQVEDDIKPEVKWMMGWDDEGWKQWKFGKKKNGEVVGYQGRHCWKQKNQKFD